MHKIIALGFDMYVCTRFLMLDLVSGAMSAVSVWNKWKQAWTCSTYTSVSQVSKLSKITRLKGQVVLLGNFICLKQFWIDQIQSDLQKVVDFTLNQSIFCNWEAARRLLLQKLILSHCGNFEILYNPSTLQEFQQFGQSHLLF